MPANQMFTPAMTNLHIRLEDLSTKGQPGFTLWVATQRLGEVEKTKVVQMYSGLEVDFLETAVKTATGCWLYKEPRDLPRDLAAVVKLARDHARTHGF